MPIILLLLVACGLTTVRPQLEMKYASEAFKAAMAVNASELAPDDYRKAEFYYLKAMSSYRRKYFNDALRYAKASLKYSERAEYLAERIKAME